MIRTVRTICTALALWFTGVAVQVAAAPALEIYGRLPGFEMAAMSPSGNRVAIVGIIEEKRRLMVVENGNPILAMEAGEEKVRSLMWADEDHILLRISKTVALGGGFTTDKAELSAVLVIPMNGKRAWSVFDNKESVTGGVFGQYGIVRRDGQTYAYFGGITLQRTYAGEYRLSTGQPDLYQVDLAIARGQIGGYAALAGVTLQQGLYRCAVSVAGIGDVAKLATDARMESGGNPTVARWLKVEIGTGRDLKLISPEAFADRADAPILLIHGKDDTVVPFRQSSDMLNALKRAGKPAELVTLAGEDHWLSKSETRLTMLKAAVAFVEKHNPPDK